jgi:hypothetical protein
MSAEAKVMGLDLDDIALCVEIARTALSNEYTEHHVSCDIDLTGRRAKGLLGRINKAEKSILAIMAAGSRDPRELYVALEESLKLQSHYARLLNLRLGGERRVFITPEAWIARLKKNGTLKSPKKKRKKT